MMYFIINIHILCVLYLIAKSGVDMQEKICSFFGHRLLGDIDSVVLFENLKKVIEELIVKKEFFTFYFGGFGEFDDLCHKVVTVLREKYPYIRRVYCLSDVQFLRRSKRPKYLRDEDYEEFIYLELSYDYWYTRLYYRNCEIINESSFIIFYTNKNENSGAYKAYKYAIRKNKNYINLFNE